MKNIIRTYVMLGYSTPPFELFSQQDQMWFINKIWALDQKPSRGMILLNKP